MRIIRVLKMLPKIKRFTDTQTKDKISSMQHRLQYNNAAQHWWYSAILVVNIISYTGKFAKMVHSYFLVIMVVGVPITLT